MSILDILEAHSYYVHTNPHSMGYWARCSCGEWTSEGQQSEDHDFTPEHRAHVAQMLEHHEREAKAEAVREAARYIERLMPPGLVHREAVLADLTVAELRISRGLHANGRDMQ